MPKTGASKTRRRILVVDDEPSVCQAVKMMLEFDDHSVDTAGSGSEALDKFDAGEFDLVITDFDMPGMKGDKLALMLKERAEEVPVLMITAHAEMLSLPLKGIECVISKPFLLENLREAIRKSAVPRKRLNAKTKRPARRPRSKHD
ncbi:MAG TPA: response regulator [Verrucomicrobiae bacterium]|nr:response regulator [Verrucomicrobiae bacterium]